MLLLPPPFARRPAAVLALTLAPLVAGCAASRFTDRTAPISGPTEIAAAPDAASVRALPAFRGDTGTALGWPDVMSAIAWADVILVGEQHDDAVGHALERAIVEDTCRRWPGSVLSMEMLERDEQPLVDDYFDGIIDAEQLARLTFSESWAGEGSWADWYQPIIDAARDGGGRVVAANAPRRYVRLARKDGYARLADLPADRRAWVRYPSRLPGGSYRARFWEVMTAEGRRAEDDGTAEDPADPHAHRLTDAQIEAIFRSQLVWDATMADSIARASRAGAPKVVHLLGQFHCDFDGGTVQELRKRLPGARILVISMQRAWPGFLLAVDRDRADIVIYTGARPPAPEDTEEPPAPDSSDDDAPAESSSPS